MPQPNKRMRRASWLAAAFGSGILFLLACSATRDVSLEALEPVALAVGQDDAVYFGERKSGVIRVTSTGEVVATVDVVSDGQRGLLGVAVDLGGGVYAAWTRSSDGRLVVAQVAPGEHRLVWEGPESKVGANGGRILFDQDGSLLVAVGSLRRGALTVDPEAPNGKVLRLDPKASPSEQAVQVVSGGWNNPFAITLDAEGTLWVADNDPGDARELLDVGNADMALGESSVWSVELPQKSAPSGMAVLSDGSLVVCSYLRNEIQIYAPRNGTTGPRLRLTLPEPCKLGLVVLSDDRIVYATETGLETVQVP